MWGACSIVRRIGGRGKRRGCSDCGNLLGSSLDRPRVYQLIRFASRFTVALHFLSLEGQARPNLVPRLVQLIRIQRQTQTNCRARVEFRAVRQSRNTAIVHLDLCEANGVKLVLGRQLHPTRFAGLHVVPGFGGDFGGRIDFLVEAGGDDAQVLRTGDGCDVIRGLVAESEGVLCHGGFLHVVACFAADKEAFVAGCDIDNGVNVTARLGVVEEGAGMKVGVLEGEGEFLCRGGSFAWVPEVLQVDLGAGSDDVDKFDFAVEQRGGRPGLRDGDAWMSTG